MEHKNHNGVGNGVDDLSLVAAIDLGSNSFHMIVARFEQNEIRPLDRLGKKVQLAAGLTKENCISEAAMQRGLDCLTEFAQYLSGKTFQSVRIVGTNTLRKAKNSSVFVEKARGILPYPVEVIAGREEARLIYLGVAQTQADDDGRRLVIDIGGGSTEFIIGEKFEPKLLESLHMGCVTFTERYFKDGKITPERFQSAYYAVQLELLNISKQYRKLGWTDTVGSSGSIKAVSSILHALTGSEIITLGGLEILKNKLLHFHDLKSLQIPGLRPERQAIFPGGLAILLASFDALGLNSMRFSEGALREGVLYSMMGRDQHEDVRERTINALASRYHVDSVEAGNISEHAQRCFEQTEVSWGLSRTDDLPMLIWAARLCKIGLDISHTQFNNHGAYLISHSDLMGFSKQQQRDMAFLVGGHRHSIPRAELSSYSKKNETRLLKLVILLRVACLINHSSIQPIGVPYVLEAYKQKLSLTFPEKWVDEHPLTRAEMAHEASYLSKVGYTLSIA